MTPAETPTWEDAAVETQKTLNLALRRITELEHLLASRDARIRELVGFVSEAAPVLAMWVQWLDTRHIDEDPPRESDTTYPVQKKAAALARSEGGGA